MAPSNLIRALDHPYRQAVLRALKVGALSYSESFSRVEPQGIGRGRFNYHLKILRGAGLLQLDDGLYHLTAPGDSAVVLLDGGTPGSARVLPSLLPGTVVGGPYGLAFFGTVLVLSASLEAGELMSDALDFSVLAVGSTLLLSLVAIHWRGGSTLSTPTQVPYFAAGATLAFAFFTLPLLARILFSPAWGSGPGYGDVPLVYAWVVAGLWVLLLAREREWHPWRWVAQRHRETGKEEGPVP